MFEKLRENVRGLVKKISMTELKGEDLRSVLWEFKLALIENDVAVVVADHMCEEIEKRLTGLKVSRLEDRKKLVRETLRTVLLETLESPERIDLQELIEKKKAEREPAVIVFVGINGIGKTTTIAKIANHLLKEQH